MSVEPDAAAVMAPRRYDASGRRAGAARHRAAVLDAAQLRFLRDGYSSTTVASIAAEGRVSVDTVYKSFGGKPGLVRAIHARALRGVGQVPAPERSDALGSEDPHALVRGWGALLAEVAPLVAPVLLLIRDAAAGGDAELTALLAETDGERVQRMTVNARRLHDGGHLRKGVTLDDATDVLWTWTAPELYELFVLRRGWSAQRFGRFAADAMTSALLPVGRP